MAQSNIIEMVKSLCKLYKGGDKNPYDPDSVKPSEWANEYLKFQIWDAEYSVVRGFEWWYDTWKHTRPKELADKAEKAEEVYKLAIFDKLQKIKRDDIDFQAMYFAL